LKVIFIRSGNHGLDPVSQNQGDSLIKSGINVTYYDIKGKGIQGYLKNILGLKRIIESENPNILHAHYALSGFIATLTFSKKPILVSLMGSDVNKTSRLFLNIIRLFVNYFWVVTIVKTKGMKNLLGIEKVQIIPNGVDMKMFRPIQKSIAIKRLLWNSQKKNILFGSDPVRIEKNYELFRKSADKLESVYSGFEIHYLNGVPREDVFLYYCAADVLLLTSYMEGSPNVIKEAMACNCPIVSTDVGDIREITSGTEGCFIASFNPDDVCKKIRLALEFGKRTTGRNKISGLSSELIAQRLITLYEGIIKLSH
jgi:glycosyltransferase involved in cell wall biosynthesis